MGKRSFFTIVEFGTSKITAVHCSVNKEGEPVILGFATADSGNCVVKGDIVDVQKAEQILTKVLEAADDSVGSYFGRGDVYFLISGRSVSSLRGEGCVMIYSADKHIMRFYKGKNGAIFTPFSFLFCPLLRLYIF